MSKKSILKYSLWLIVIALAASACSSGDLTDAAMSDEMDEEHAEAAFGVPADASDATRVIEISATDNFRFDPDAIRVASGEVVTFKVTNDGNIPHDFVLGGTAVQDEHEEEMQNMTDSTSMSHDEPNAFVIDPGETKEMTWRMTETGEIIMGCHQPGHFAAGMQGTIEIGG